MRHLMAFFASVFNSKTSCSLGIQPSEQEDGEQHEAPIIQGGNGQRPATPLGHTHKSTGIDGIHGRVLRELVEVLT